MAFEDTFIIESQEVNDLLESLADKRKTKPLMGRVGRIMHTDAMLNFRTKSDPNGRPWAPIQRKGQILRDTSRLRNSIGFRVVGDDTTEIGTNVKYGRAHQYGFIGNQRVPKHTRRITKAFGKTLSFPVYQTVRAHTRKMNIKARPVLGVGNRALRKIDKALEDWAAELVDT